MMSLIIRIAPFSFRISSTGRHPGRQLFNVILYFNCMNVKLVLMICDLEVCDTFLYVAPLTYLQVR